MRFVLVPCASILLLLASSRAAAQDPTPQTQPSEERARALFQAGRAAVEEGDFEGAMRYFQECYALAPRPELLFNLGNAAERLRRDEEALDFYRRYIEEVPDAPNGAFVRGRIRALAAAAEAAAEATPEPESDPAPPAPPPSSPGSSSDGTGWALLIVGAVVAAGGVTMIAIGAAERSAVDNAPVGSSWTEYAGRHDAANILAGVGTASLVAGLATAVGGLILATSSGSADADVALEIGPARVGLRGRF